MLLKVYFWLLVITCLPNFNFLDEEIEFKVRDRHAQFKGKVCRAIIVPASFNWGASYMENLFYIFVIVLAISASRIYPIVDGRGFFPY